MISTSTVDGERPRNWRPGIARKEPATMRRARRTTGSGTAKGPREGPSPAKAKEMLRHGEVRDKALTVKQKGLFGLIASGKRPTRRTTG